MSKNLFIQESWVNATDGHRTGQSEVYETRFDDTGELFRSLQQEYGRCTGKVYIDDLKGNSRQTGWVFQKRQKYDDCNDTFLLETWVTVHEEPETRSVKYHYHKFN